MSEIEELKQQIANLKEQLAAREARIQELNSLQELNNEALETTESALLSCQAREGELETTALRLLACLNAAGSHPANILNWNAAWRGECTKAAEVLSHSTGSKIMAVEQARGLLLWALYHHQGGSSEVGQPIRKFLGIGEYDHLTPEQIAEAKEAVRALEDK